jgi:hypothetical protein
MHSLRKHSAILLLLLVAAPLTLHFVWHRGLASIGDDSVSYLILARWIAGSADPFVREWVAYQTNFPPLFPLVLAAGGASRDYLAAHVVVGVCALLALPMLYRYAAFQLQSARAGLAVVVFFLLTPTAWTSIVGILSEPLFLLVTLAALHFHAARLATPSAKGRDALIFGALLGLAFLTRTAAVSLVAAYCVHALIEAVSRKSAFRWRLIVPLLPFAAMAGAWTALRPAFEGENYGLGLRIIAELARHDPAHLALIGARGLANGWVASFVTQAEVHVVMRAVILAVGALALCGAVMRARRNALDGWYVLASLAMLFFWFQHADTTRRLLYPLVPVMLVHAAGLVRFIAARMRRGLLSRALPAVLALAVIAVCLPALILVHTKSFDRRLVVAGFPYSFSGTTELYTGLSIDRTRTLAARHLAILVGLHALQVDTPPGAKIMWMRPDYVALVGGRQGVAWRYPEGLRGLAERLRASGAGYLIVTSLYKSDMWGESDEPFETLAAVSVFARAVSVTRNAESGASEFALLQVDPAALAAFLAAR